MVRSARDTYHFLDESFFEAERTEIERAWIPIAETWVYEADGAVAGFISLIEEHHVGALFVDPPLQGRSFGQALMDFAREQRGRLELDVFAENERGRRFYDRYGFRQVGEHVHEPTGHLELRLELPE